MRFRQGRGALIDADLAREQLKLRLDVDQRFTNGFNTRLDAPVPLAPPITEAQIDAEIDHAATQMIGVFDKSLKTLAGRVAARYGTPAGGAYWVFEAAFAKAREDLVALQRAEPPV